MLLLFINRSILTVREEYINNIKGNIMKRNIIIALLMIASSSCFALRCGNTLINVGDAGYTVTQSCTIDHEYRVQNNNADIVKYYVKESGSLTDEIVVVDGKIQSINIIWK